MLIDGLPLEAPAAPLNDLLRVGLDTAAEEPALVSALLKQVVVHDGSIRTGWTDQ